MNLHLILASLTATPLTGHCGTSCSRQSSCVGDSITFGTGLKRRNPGIRKCSPGPDFDVNFRQSRKNGRRLLGQAGRWYGSTREHKQALGIQGGYLYLQPWHQRHGPLVEPRTVSMTSASCVENANPKTRFFAWGAGAGRPAQQKGISRQHAAIRTYVMRARTTAHPPRPEAEKLIAVARSTSRSLILHPLWYNPEWYVSRVAEQGARRIAEITLCQAGCKKPQA